jgi:hypothetical protein
MSKKLKINTDNVTEVKLENSNDTNWGMTEEEQEEFDRQNMEICMKEHEKNQREWAKKHRFCDMTTMMPLEEF